MKRPYLLIMAKAPRVGAVKTRLARDIGTIAAWRFYVGTLNAAAHNLPSPFWKTVLHATPDRAWVPRPGGVARLDQGPGDLGRRMLRGLTAAPRGTPVILIGSDIPGVTVPILRRAVHALGSADAVFGPAADGGFWLVGFSGRRTFWRPFAGVPWSTVRTLAATLANFRGRAVVLATTLSDVDDVRSWLSAKDAL